MSWKSLDTKGWRRTLKYRLTKYYVGIFTLLWIGSMLLVYQSQSHFQMKNAKRSLFFLANECQFELICHKEGPVDAIATPIENLPEHCKKKIQDALKGFVPYAAYYIREHMRYLVAGIQDGVPMLLTVDGKELSIERYPKQEYLEFLHGEFNEEAYGQWQNPILLIVTGPDGKILTTSSFDSVFRPLVEKLFHLDEPLEGYRRISDGKNSLLFFISRLYDGNLLLVAQNMEKNNAHLRHLLGILGCSLVVFIVAGVCLAFLVAQKFTDGLTRISQTALDIARGHYGRRVEYKSEDIEIEMLIQAFNHMADNTEKMLKELENVTDDIAHDLRTPLTRMKARAELELANQVNMDFAASVAENCDEMLSTSNIMLEISRIEKHAGHALQTQVNVNALLEKLHEAFLTIAEDKHIQFNLLLPKNALSILGNARQLEQMAANLIDNAIKYTQDGGSVNVMLEKKDNCLKLSVSDTGIGIRQEDIPRIFNRFFRGDTSRSTHGNGLGLSMVKAIAESMGGTVTVESSIGNGSLFVVSLPLNSSMT